RVLTVLLSSACLFYFYGAPRDLHSFPTRRSSDLGDDQLRVDLLLDPDAGALGARAVGRVERERARLELVELERVAVGAGHALGRSEEHTSELQSRENLVCRLLLEKKKNKKRVQIQ